MFDEITRNANKKGRKMSPEYVPYVSSLVESRLLIAAVNCNNMDLLSELKVYCIMLTINILSYYK